MNIEKRVLKPAEVRRKGLVPGVIYGKDFPSTPIQVPNLKLVKKIAEVGTSKTFSILLDEKKHIVYVREYQHGFMDPSSYIHFDLVKVSIDDILQSNVSLHFIGKENFTKSSLVFTTNLDEIEVEYNVGSGISYLDLDVTTLTEDTPIYVKDLTVPKGIKVLNDPEQMVCSLSQATIIEDTVADDEQEGFFQDSEDEEE